MEIKQYIIFEEINTLPKTEVYGVYNKKTNTLLGIIKWNSPWKRYCFYPDNNIVFSKDCMEDINEFIQKLMNKRK